MFLFFPSGENPAAMQRERGEGKSSSNTDDTHESSAGGNTRSFYSYFVLFMSQMLCIIHVYLSVSSYDSISRPRTKIYKLLL